MGTCSTEHQCSAVLPKTTRVKSITTLRRVREKRKGGTRIRVRGGLRVREFHDSAADLKKTKPEVVATNNCWLPFALLKFAAHAKATTPLSPDKKIMFMVLRGTRVLAALWNSLVGEGGAGARKPGLCGLRATRTETGLVGDSLRLREVLAGVEGGSWVPPRRRRTRFKEPRRGYTANARPTRHRTNANKMSRP